MKKPVIEATVPESFDPVDSIITIHRMSESGIGSQELEDRVRNSIGPITYDKSMTNRSELSFSGSPVEQENLEVIEETSSKSSLSRLRQVPDNKAKVVLPKSLPKLQFKRSVAMINIKPIGSFNRNNLQSKVVSMQVCDSKNGLQPPKLDNSSLNINLSGRRSTKKAIDRTKIQTCKFSPSLSTVLQPNNSCNNTRPSSPANLITQKKQPTLIAIQDGESIFNYMAASASVDTQQPVMTNQKFTMSRMTASLPSLQTMRVKKRSMRPFTGKITNRSLKKTTFGTQTMTSVS